MLKILENILLGFKYYELIKQYLYKQVTYSSSIFYLKYYSALTF